MQTEDPGFADWAFTVVVREVATAELTFAHEFGHIMGCCREFGGGQCDAPKITECAHGHAYYPGGLVTERRRTVMAVGYGLRELFFSNPSKKHMGMPTGIAGVSENFHVINETADTVSNFR